MSRMYCRQLSILPCRGSFPQILRRYIPIKVHHSHSEYQLENTLTSRHAVEEAMSTALIRRCNICGQPFVKDGGCNQMTCSCGNSQCFICSQNVDGHDH